MKFRWHAAVHPSWEDKKTLAKVPAPGSERTVHTQGSSVRDGPLWLVLESTHFPFLMALSLWPLSTCSLLLIQDCHWLVYSLRRKYWRNIQFYQTVGWLLVLCVGFYLSVVPTAFQSSTRNPGFLLGGWGGVEEVGGECLLILFELPWPQFDELNSVFTNNY